jgi:hypothetical protein
MTDTARHEIDYRRSEIARLAFAVAAARPNARTTNVLRAQLKHHEDELNRPEGAPRVQDEPIIFGRRRKQAKA